MNRYLRPRIRTTVWEAQRIRRLTQRRSYAQGSFGMTTKKGTDLKGKRSFRPRWITIESLANVKGMGVILHGLHLVPINRWTVLLYCSRWLGICFCVTLVPLPSFNPKVQLFMLSLTFHMILLFYRMLQWWRYVFHNHRLKIIIS
jgi:hypothetical protein